MAAFVDDRITESSGLAASRIYKPVLWTVNDDGSRVFAVNGTSGKTVATYRIDGLNQEAEAVCLDHHSRLWIAAIGDNDADLPYVRLYVRGEPPPNHDYGILAVTRYKVVYPGGPRNAESFFVHPTTGVAYIISKEGTGKLYSLPAKLYVDRLNTLTLVNSSMGANVADAAITPDGRFLLTRRESQNTTVYVHQTSDWAQVGTITVPSQPKPEGIAVAPDQLSFWISSEGVHAAIHNVSMPTAYRPVAVTPTPPPAVPATPCG